MQNKEELRQKGHARSRKKMCHKRGDTIISEGRGGGGINIVYDQNIDPWYK
jgi:hypothetical protein